jgi:protein-S-isoprenylcysteine O-methyltransferase Ste14
MKKGPLMPPVWLLLHAIALGLLHWLAPGKVLIAGRMRLAGLVPLVAGAALVLYCAGLFSRAGTTIKPFQESSELVTSGPYRFSRNPIYLGMAIALCGIAIALGTLTPWILVVPFVALITARFIRPEEEMLRARFGGAYDAYTRRVRRWI